MRRKTILIVLSVAAAVAAVAGVVSAGNPDNPPGPPETTASYRLEDIYNRLAAGAAGAQITFTEPISGPGVGTGHTLDEIMGIAPSIDDIDGATSAQVAAGATFWGLRNGSWGLQTGTANAGGDVVGGEGQLAFTIPDGFYTGSRTATAQDSDLVSGNVRSGVNLFGVDGALTTGSTFDAGVPATGQTQCYTTTNESETSCPAPGYPGQDGEVQAGVAWPIPRFITDTTGIVTDTLTGLIWLQDANCFGEMTWAQALSVTLDLASGECGLSDGSSAGDWRLPNVRELESLVDYAYFNPVVPNTAGTGRAAEGDPFHGVQSSDYWTSTTKASETSQAWYVGMSSGYSVLHVKTNVNYVWPVRGGH